MSKNTQLTASQKRAANPDPSTGSGHRFVKTFSLEALKDRLPFRFPVPEDVLPSPKRRYRSQYCYLGYDHLLIPGILATLTRFEIALRLIDFSPLRDYLAQFPGLSVQDRLLRPECQRSGPLRPRFPLPLHLPAPGTELELAGSGQTPGRRARDGLEATLRLSRGCYPFCFGPALFLQHGRPRGVR